MNSKLKKIEIKKVSQYFIKRQQNRKDFISFGKLKFKMIEKQDSTERKVISNNKNAQNAGQIKSKSEYTKSDKVPTYNAQSITNGNQTSKVQSISSQPQVVRHKIYQIKLMEIPSNSQINRLNNQNFSKQVSQKQTEKKQEIKEKQIKAISNVFGQFFKVQNLRNYSKPQENEKLKIKQTSITKIENKGNSENEGIKKGEKGNFDGKIQQKAQQNKNQKQQAIPHDKDFNPQSFEGKQIKRVINEILPQSKQNEENQYRYSEPEFKLLQIEQKKLNLVYKDRNFHKVTQTKNNSPQINFQSEEESFNSKNGQNHSPQKLKQNPNVVTGKSKQVVDSPTKFVENIDKNSPYGLKQFINMNQFTHPLVQSSSRDSFFFSDSNQRLSHNATQKVLKTKEVSDKNQLLKPNLSLGNLEPIIIKNDNLFSCQKEEQMVSTPFFQNKIRDSENVHQIQEQFLNSEKIQTIQNKENPTKSKNIHVCSLQKESKNQQSPSKIQFNNISQQNIIMNESKRQFQSDSQIERIKKMFVSFDMENKLMIDPLSYEIGFQSLEEVSSNLINDMDKRQEDNYVQSIVQKGLQQKWKQQLFGKINQNITFSPRKGNIQIKQPKPTQSSSPSKFDNFLISQEKNLTEESVNNKFAQSNSLIRKKTPLKLPVLEHNRVSSHVEYDFDISQLQSFYEDKSTPEKNESHLPLDSAEKHFRTKNHQPFSQQKQSLTISQEPSSILQFMENKKQNSQQIEEIREFYNYLRLKELDYYGNNHSQDPNRKQGQIKIGQDDQKQQKLFTFQNLHLIKETSKPVINLNLPHQNIHKAVSNTTNVTFKPNIQSKKDKRSASKPNQSSRTLYSKEKKSLESVVLTFRRNNYSGDHQNFKEQVISLSQSRQNNQHSDPHVSFIQHPRMINPIYKDLTNMQANHQSFIDERQKRQQEKPLLKQIVFPIQNIEPIKVTSSGKRSKGKQSQKRSKSPQVDKSNPISARKMKVVSVNIAPSSTKPIETPNIIKPLQIGPLLFNSSHLGSFMMNNVIKGYINTHPIDKSNEHLKHTKQSQILNSLITKDDGKRLQKASKIIQLPIAKNLQSTQKKKIQLKRNESSSKKLSINQKPVTDRKQTQNKTGRLNFQEGKRQQKSNSKFHKLNPQLKQTIERVNNKKEKQLYDLIIERIAEKQNSRTLSSNLQSPQRNKFNNQSFNNEQNNSLSDFKFHSKQILTSRTNNILSLTKKYPSNSQDKSLIKSKNSSKSSKKSGIELWNSNLSELKSSRKLNSNKKQFKIFNQQNTRKDQKIIGITKWNENLSTFKQIRSKSNESRLSSNSKTKQNSKGGFIFTNTQKSNEQKENTMNIQIKKYKHQVSNVQKKYF